ncbi:MAG: DUF2569 family protein [Acidobacteria bacterium]|nr:DUF2569 family protein [Acidobacteriota bacterium]
MDPAAIVLVALLPVAVLMLIAWGVARWIKRIGAKVPNARAAPATEPAGVGGWLLLLTLGLVFLGPLLGAGRINADFMAAESQFPNLKTVDAWATLKQATWLVYLPISCLSVYAGYGLLKRRNRSVVRRAQLALWVIGPLATVVIGLVLPRAIVGDADAGPEFIGGLIASALVASVWTAYLSRSKRVNATYGAADTAA